MTLHVRDAGSWKEVNELSVRDAGAWKDVQEAWVRDGGTWKQFFTALAIVLTNRTVASVGFGAQTASIIFKNTGQLSRSTTGIGESDISGEWMDPVGGATPGDYEVRGQLQSGTTPSGPALGSTSWHNLGTTRTWSVSSSGGLVEAVVRFDIRPVGGSILATGDITLQAEELDSS